MGCIAEVGTEEVTARISLTSLLKQCTMEAIGLQCENGYPIERSIEPSERCEGGELP